MKTDKRHVLGRRPSPRISLGLELMSACAATQPPRAYSAYEIAAWCDCTAKAIYQIEARALRKLRRLVRSGASALCEELSETAPARARVVTAPRVRRECVEVPLKQWVAELAEREGVSRGAIYMRLYRHPEKMPAVRRVNGRVVMVQLRAA
jgi:hypothetical protein